MRENDERSPFGIDWAAKPSRMVCCPVCADTGSKPFVLTTQPSWTATSILDLHSCPDCECMFFPDLVNAVYEGNENIESAVKFYVEVGAGLDQLVTPGYMAPMPQGSKYLEIGCGFGFGLDYAQRNFEFQIAGLDPSKIAEFGRSILGLPTISGYLTRDTDLGDRRFDLAVVSEVIEHIFKPAEFIDIVAARLSDDGVLLINTPIAKSARPSTPLGVLIPLLSPGWHYILFSEKGMQYLLKQAGFAKVETRVRDHTLLAYATNGRRSVNLGASLDHGQYRSYLERRIAGQKNTWLRHGFKYRLLKSLANAGKYERAVAAYEELRSDIRATCGFDIGQPVSSWFHPAKYPAFHEFALAYPMFLTGVGYARGVIAMNHEADYATAEANFELSVIYGSELRKRLQAMGADDGETENLSRHSGALLRRAVAWRSPADAVQQTLHEDASANAQDLALLAHVVNLGALEDAAQLRVRCEGILRMPMRADVPDRTAADARRALGVLLLNRDQNPRRAAAHFAASARAARAAGADDAYWLARAERALAWTVAGNSTCANAALAPLQAAMGDGRLSQDLATRVTKLADQLTASGSEAIGGKPTA